MVLFCTGWTDYVFECNKWTLWKMAEYWPGLRPFSNSCLSFLWFSFALGDAAMFFRCNKWSLQENERLTGFTIQQVLFNFLQVVGVFLRVERYIYIYIGCCKWLLHGKTKYWPSLRLGPFNNSCLIFIADDVFALEPDAGLAERDLGAIDQVVGSDKESEAVYKYEQGYAPSIWDKGIRQIAEKLSIL